jgi:DNA-binding NarL/FixJ family response regulator
MIGEPSNPEARKIRVMLVDDHMLMRMGLSFALNNHPDIQVVAEAEDGIDAIEIYRQHHPDVVLLDLRMPKRNGIETIGLLRREFGAVHVLILSSYSSGHEIGAALQAGAFGFVVKDTPLAGLVEAIRHVAAGEQFISPTIAHHLAGRISSHLSAREMEVLALIAKGKSNKEIGAALNVAEVTVKVHVTNILSKLNVADRTQAIVTAIKRGIIQLD